MLSKSPVEILEIYILEINKDKRGDEERNSGGPRRKLKATYTLRYEK